MKISALVFDMDGLLLDTERLGFRWWSQAAEDFGYMLTPEVFSNMMGRPREDNARYLKTVFGDDFPSEAVRNRRVEIGDADIAVNGIPLRPGAKEILEFGKSKNLKIALATSTYTDIAVNHLHHVGLHSYFQAIIGGEQVANSKPAPDIFLKAIAVVDARPDESIVFEDSKAGVIGAHAAGARVIWVPDLITPTEELTKRAWHTLNSLHEAPAILLPEL